MLCPECNKQRLQVSDMQAALEPAYDHSNLITIVEATCKGCRAVFETRSVTTLGWRRVKRGSTERTADSSTSSSVKAADVNGSSLPSPTNPTPDPEWFCGCGNPMAKCAPENCHHPFATRALWGD